MRVFTRVVERRSFSLARTMSAWPRSTVTDAVKGWKPASACGCWSGPLGKSARRWMARRTTDACLSLIAELEDAEGAFGGAKPKGTAALEVQGTLARHFLLPNLPGFFAQYPDIEINMSESDRWIDWIREGVDCVLRFGHLPDSDMIARQVVVLERLTCAAPNLFRATWHADKSRRARRTPHDRLALAHDRTIAADGNFWSTAHCARFHYRVIMSVTGPESYRATARLGLGLVQVPRFHAETDLANGTLIPVLFSLSAAFVPVSLLYHATANYRRASAYYRHVMRAFGRA